MGERQASLTQLLIEPGSECTDTRLFPWDPFADLRVMLLRIEDETHEELVELEIRLVDGVAVQTRKPHNPWPVYPVIEPQEEDARVLVSANHRLDVSLPFVRGLHVVVMRKSIYAFIDWVDEDGEPIRAGRVTIERVPEKGSCLSPFSFEFSLSVAWRMKPNSYPAMLFPSIGRYRVIERDGLFEPGEFEVPDEANPKIRVVLRRRE